MFILVIPIQIDINIKKCYTIIDEKTILNHKYEIKRRKTMSAYDMITNLSSQKVTALKNNVWLKFLYLNESTRHINIENFDMVESITPSETLAYVTRCLKVLENEKRFLTTLTLTEANLIEDVLCWSEVAKSGNSYFRSLWRKENILLDIHNVGSKQIYKKYNANKVSPEYLELVCFLLDIHGAIGQYIRGEVSLKKYTNITTFNLPDINLQRVLEVLTKCVITGVKVSLYEDLKDEISQTISSLFLPNSTLHYADSRLQRLRKRAIMQGENVDEIYSKFIQDFPELEEYLIHFLNTYDVWYVESALTDIGLTEVLKLFAYLDIQLKDTPITDVSFEALMSFYCDLNGKKVMNLFKERVVERLLRKFDITSGEKLADNNVALQIKCTQKVATVHIYFEEKVEKLLDYCITAYGSNTLHNQIIYDICNLLDIRRDGYDRIYNEESYLATMNESTNFKLKILDYLSGNTIVDIGPGGGALMDAIVKRFPNKHVIGVDLSENVVQALQRRKFLENLSWEVIQGNALYLKDIFKPESVDTFIFCSNIHEIFSFNQIEGKRFQYASIKLTLSSAYRALKKGGRLIIRDGIMTNSNQNRIIHFKDATDISILEDYVSAFEGRKIQYKKLDDSTVLMPINDAMEFCYTYTWGPDSFAQEVQEQFGYFTPKEYQDTITECFEGNCEFITLQHYLQDGYAEHLNEKIDFLDEDGIPTTLPDSTCFIVVEKI